MSMNEIETFFCYNIEKTQDEHGEGINTTKKMEEREKIATATVVAH